MTSVPANGNHKQKKAKRAAKANVVTAHCSPALDTQVLITVDIMCRLKPRNIALGPTRKLNPANDPNMLHTDTVLFTHRYHDSIILGLHSSFDFDFSATLTVLYSHHAVSIILFVLINSCIYRDR